MFTGLNTTASGRICKDLRDVVGGAPLEELVSEVEGEVTLHDDL